MPRLLIMYSSDIATSVKYRDSSVRHWVITLIWKSLITFRRCISMSTYPIKFVLISFCRACQIRIWVTAARNISKLFCVFNHCKERLIFVKGKWLIPFFCRVILTCKCSLATSIQYFKTTLTPSWRASSIGLNILVCNNYYSWQLCK